jgi:hypothetical protein
VLKDRLGRQAKLEWRVTLVRMDAVDRRDRGDQQGTRGKLETQETLGLKDLLVRQARREMLDPRGLKEPLARRVLLARLDL